MGTRMKSKAHPLTRRQMLKGAAVSMVALGASSCGAATPQVIEKVVEKEVTRVVEGTPQIVKETVVVEAGTAPEQPTNVYFLSYDLNQDAMDWLGGPFVEMVESEHPDINLDVRFVPWGAFRESLMTDFVAGTAPDLFIEGTNSIPVYASKGGLLPIDDWLDTVPDLDDFLPKAFNQCKYKGYTFGMLYEIGPRMYLYQTALLEKAGVSAPETWDDWLSFVKEMTVLDEGNLIQAAIPQYCDFDYAFHSFVAQAGGEFSDPTATTALFDQPEALEALEFYIEFQNTAYPQGVNPLAQMDIPYLVAGNMACDYLAGPWWGKSIMQYASEEATATIQTGPTLKNKQQAVVDCGDAILMTKTRNPAQAFTVMAQFTSTESLVQLQTIFGWPPPRKSALEDPRVKETVPFIEDWVAAHELSVSPFSVANYFEVRQACQDQVCEALALVKTPQAALQEVQQIFQAALDAE